MLATRDSDGPRAIASALRDADASIARALELLGRTNIPAETGLSAESFLILEAGWTMSDARALVKAEHTLRAMPLTRARFRAGLLSWSQVRAICTSVRTVDVVGRAAIDAAVEEQATSGNEPDELLARLDDLVAERRADLALAREDRAIERSFLAVHRQLDGAVTIYGEADAQSSATIVQALDLLADPPVDPRVDGTPSRARQRMEAFIRMCEMTLNGGRSGRPRPRLLATIDVDAFAKDARTESARVLTAIAGRPARLSHVATETLLCDATVQQVVFDGARPVAVADAASPIGPKLRAALAARDGGCRFPGCAAPVDWCDAHHIRARAQDGPTEIDNLILLCRRCHRTIHRFRWRILARKDGTIDFHRQGRSYSSTPRARRAAPG